MRKIAVSSIFVLSIISFMITCIWAYYVWFDFEPFVGIFASLATALAAFISLLDLYGVTEEDVVKNPNPFFEKLPFLGNFYATFRATFDMIFFPRTKYEIKNSWVVFSGLNGMEFYFYAALIHSIVLIFLLLGYKEFITSFSLILTFTVFNTLQIGVYLIAFLIGYPLYKYILIEKFDKQEYIEKLKNVISLLYFTIGLVILLSTINVTYEVLFRGKDDYLQHVVKRDAKPEIIDALLLIIFTALIPLSFLARTSFKLIGQGLVITWLLTAAVLYYQLPTRASLIKLSETLKSRIFVNSTRPINNSPNVQHTLTFYETFHRKLD